MQSHERRVRVGWAVPLVVAVALVAAACGGGSEVVAGDEPTVGPDGEPTATATAEPTPTPRPTSAPTGGPTATPLATPTTSPTPLPQPTPTPVPTATSTPEPTATPMPDPAVAELVTARGRWAAAGFDEYAYSLILSCECDDEAMGPRRVRVDGGRVIATTWFGEPSRYPGWSVEEIFSMVEETLADGKRVNVTYDSASGMPVRVRLDLDAIPVDGGLDLTITDVLVIDTIRAELAAARSAWAAAGITDYDLTYRQSCFCPRTVITSQVRDGVSVAVDVDSAFDFEPTVVTVEDLFDEISRALDDGAFGIFAVYHPEFGHPTEYFIDMSEFIADEEFGAFNVRVVPI